MAYDFIVVGGGTAGCVLAARLSEDGAASVLLLEAGRDYRHVSALPENLRDPYGQPSWDQTQIWHYQGYPTADSDRLVDQVRGKVIGGSGSVNGSVFQRGAPEDYDAWGSDLWSFEAVLPYFKKMETDWDFQDDYHGTSGPIDVRRFAPQTRLSFAFGEAATNLGHPHADDLNAPSSTGIGPLPWSVGEGIRASGFTAYLAKVRDRSNLTVIGGATVGRVLFEGDTAIGVSYKQRGSERTALASEVVMAAGAINTPHLLMLSGIGPERELSAAGIATVADLPGIGRNLSDHAAITILFNTSSADRSEPLPSLRLLHTSAGSSERNDIHISQPRAPSDTQKISTASLAPLGWTVACYMALERSRGELAMSPSLPASGPTLRYGFLSETSDVLRLREGVRHAIDVLSQRPLATLISDLQPSPTVTASNKDLDRYVREHIRPASHSCGTCRMGPSSDVMAVVDEQCRVYGVQHLRVIDSSIIPTVPRAALNATVFMVAERGSDLVRGYEDSI